MLPVIRSGDLFANYDEAQQAEYFDTIATAAPEDVLPEHYYGTNGTQRLMAENGIEDRELFDREFRYTVAAMTPQQRRDFLVGRAVDRYYAPNAADLIGQSYLKSQMEAASLVSSDPNIGLISMEHPVSVAEGVLSDIYGGSLV